MTSHSWPRKVYPPYHSKYNLIERCWGILENHWNGTLLNSVHTVVEWARTMTWNGVQPVVSLIEKTYDKGVRIAKAAFKAVESRTWIETSSQSAIDARGILRMLGLLCLAQRRIFATDLTPTRRRSTTVGIDRKILPTPGRKPPFYAYALNK